MPCAICGGATLPAAKLCGACKAALKRARHETVSQLDPLPRRPSRGRRTEPRSSGGSGADAPSPPTRRGRIRLPASVVVAVGVVVIATGYFVSYLRGNAQGPDLAPVAASTAGPYVPLPTSAPTPPSAEPVALPPRETLPTAPVKPTPAVRHKAPPVVPREVVAPPPRPLTVVAEQVAAPPPVPAKAEAPAPDRWQLLAAAIAQCGNGLGGVFCEERARWQYCDGYWGKVAQCPGVIGAGVPH